MRPSTRSSTKKATVDAKSWPSPWSGPPGCTCDLTKPAKDRCSKGGWLRCQGALNAMMAQMRYRDGVGPKGGKGKKTFLEIFQEAQERTAS